MIKLIWLVSAYALGNLLTGYVLAKTVYHKEIRQEGSGNAGARNAGRLFGKKAFIFTFLGDASKGALLILMAKWLGFAAEWQMLLLLSVVLGHIYPVFLQWKGGKGMSTYIGGILAFDPILFCLFAIIFLIFYPLLRSFTIAGMIAVGLYPLLMLFYYRWEAVVISLMISVIIIFAHRQNLREKFFTERKIS
ncbi:glycerol-3-phosphate acyltransferase [Bacillus sp. FJAT-50079]|uniref:glycerol-3-phosphate acyltransferase n=1 Tax=Bacillus sp. FJAT-50079 TaxID=2833577 RepID=UPI001BCA16DF|nr:glycerol-3-phosphate acyltransferase [Bacillus sp. FJAT-50079]MBS4209193.1 glycerol-3-phosphate acyltransferase [Bacillus sp. FJAT-50079]